MNSRTAIITAVAFTLLGSLYFLNSSSTFTFPMSSSASAPLSYLEFRLSQTSKNPPAVLVTLRNKHPSSTFTILKWDTPLDSQALKLGIFEITNTESGEKIDIPRLMVNRQLPPPRDALLELTPASEHSTELVLNKPMVPWSGPGSYTIKVTGSWKAIWEKKTSEIQENELKEMGGSEGVHTGDFSCDEIELQVE